MTTLPNPKTLAVLVLLGLVALHLGNALVPMVEHDESILINVASALSDQGEYGNTWQTGRLTAPDRSLSTGPPLVLPVALAWKLGVHHVVWLRLLTVTPYFLAFLVVFWKTLGDPEMRLAGLLLLLGISDWAVFSARVIGEFAALFFLLAGWLRIERGRTISGGVLWGLAVLTKLAFLGAALLGAALWCATGRKDWRLFLRVVAGVLAPLVLYQVILQLRYGSPTDFNLGMQGFEVLFHPRNFPLHLGSLNQYFTWLLVAAGYVFAWTERERSPRWWFLCCLSVFWLLWHLAGFRGWLRYAMPGLIVLIPAAAAALLRVLGTPGPLFVRVGFLVSAAAFSFLGLYQNTYWIWISYKEWRVKRQVVQVLDAHRDRRLLGEGITFPYPHYLLLTGRRFQDARQTAPQPGDLALVAAGNLFLEREVEAGRGGQWRPVLTTLDWKMYENIAAP